MGKGVNWNGKYFIIPQAASVVDESGLNRVALGASGRLVLMGDMIGLIEPKTAKKITSPSLGLSLVHPNSEEVRQAIRLAFDPVPGSGISGANEVYLLPVNPAVQANLTIDSKLKLTSFIYGLPANQVKVKIEDGTTSGKKISIAFVDELETYDNVEKPSLSIQYTGAGSAALLSIDQGTGTLSTVCTDATDDNLSLPFATYDTIQALANAIADTGVYDVEVLSGSAAVDSCSDLDAVTDVDIKTAVVEFNSDLKAILDIINRSSGYVSAEAVSGAAAAPANQDWTYLAGGDNGTTDSDDWQEAFDLLKTMQVDLICLLTSDASIHSMGDSHCDYMSGFEGKSERRLFVGGAVQSWGNEANRTAAVTALKAAAKLLNSDRTINVGLGCKLYNEEGISTLYPAYITAAAYAGIAAGNLVSMPLTRKFLRVLGLEVELRKGEIQDLLEAGVAVPIPDLVNNAGFVISRQVTTWLQNSNDYRVEFSVGRGADYVAAEVRRRHEELVGEAGYEAMDQTLINLTNAVLGQAKRDGIINSYDPKATQVRADGTIRYIDYSADPVLPINWIFSTYHLQPTIRTIAL